MEGMISTLE